MAAHHLTDFADRVALLTMLATVAAELAAYSRRRAFRRRALTALLRGDVRRYRDTCQALAGILAAANRPATPAEPATCDDPPLPVCDGEPPPPLHIHGSRLVVIHGWFTAA